MSDRLVRLVRRPTRSRSTATDLHRQDRHLYQDGPHPGRAPRGERLRMSVPHGQCEDPATVALRYMTLSAENSAFASAVASLGTTPAVAITAGALIGPAQVAARVAEFGFLRRASLMLSARLATALYPIGAALLALIGAPAAIPFVLLHGAGNGMLTIARGTLPLALFGPAGYGLRTGLLAAPARILQGAAPLVFGLVLDRGGPILALVLTGTLTGLSLLALLLLEQRTSHG